MINTMNNEELIYLFKKIIKAADEVVGTEKTSHRGMQDYLIIGDEVNHLIDLINTAKKELNIKGEN